MTKNLTILLVEDDEMNLRLFQDLLHLKKFDVIAIKDGSIAAAEVSKHKPDLIIMDIQLNGISGLNVIKKIKENPETSTIPIIAITAFAMKDDKEKILKAGCQAYISKPVTIDEFYQAINHFLNLPQS